MPPLAHRWLVAPLLRALGGLSAATADRCGGALGVAAFHLHIRRRVAADTIQRCLGLRGPARARILRRSYASMGANFLGLFTAGRASGWPLGAEQLNPLATAAWLRTHPAMVCVSGHLGVWDLGACLLARVAGRVIGYAKPQHDPATDEIINACRDRLGIRVVFAAAGDRLAATTALRAARDGIPVCLLGDQRPGRTEGAPGWFFDQPAWCHQGPGFFAVRARMALAPALCLRRRAGRYVGFLGRPRTCADQDTAVQLAIDLQCALIAACPGQYFWQHRRFAGQPPALSARTSSPWRGRARWALTGAGVSRRAQAGAAADPTRTGASG
jgi:lauroyl/myristoyl acyltransferase